MIWSWAEVTAEQIKSPTVHGAEMIDYPPRDGLPELGPGRTWAECVPPQTVKKLLGRAVLGWTELLDQVMVEPVKLSDQRPERRGQPRYLFARLCRDVA